MKTEIRQRVSVKEGSAQIKSIDGMTYLVAPYLMSVTLDGANLPNCIEACPEGGYAIVLDTDASGIPRLDGVGEIARRAVLGTVQVWVERDPEKA